MWLSLLGSGIQWWWAFRFERLPQQATRSGTESDQAEFCSVVVCLHNEGDRVEGFANGLRGALNAAQLNQIEVEVVAVNHGSTDHTLSELMSVAREDSRWNVLSVERSSPGKKAALEAGIHRAQGEVILLLDADCQPVDPRWISSMTSGASKHWDVNVGLSLPNAMNNPPPLLSRLQRLEARRLAQRAVGAIMGGSPYLAFGRNLAFTREIWNRVGGFQPHRHLMSGDDDLWLQQAVRVGATVAATSLPRAQTSSTWPSTWRTWLKQKARHFSASPAYPLALKLRLAMPMMGWLCLGSGVVHNPSGTSLLLAALAILIRALTFGVFLNSVGQPWRETWELALEPLVSVFRGVAWWKNSISESTTWK